jgi:two-component system chemotaxis response regulator CheB
VSLKALSLGAADYIPKPATNREVTTSATFRRDLIEKVRQLGGGAKRAHAPSARARRSRCRLRAGSRAPKISVAEPRPSARPWHSDIKLRPFSP